MLPPASALKQKRGIQSGRQLGIAGPPRAADNNRIPTINDRTDSQGRPIRTMNKFRTTSIWLKDAEDNPQHLDDIKSDRNKLEERSVAAATPLLSAMKETQRAKPLTAPRDGPVFRSRPASVQGDRPASVLGNESLFAMRPLSVTEGIIASNRSPNDGPLGSQYVVGRAHHNAVERAMYFQWARSFENDREQFNSTAVWAEIVMCQVMEATKHDPVPSQLRTAAAALVLDKMLGDRGRSGLPAVLSVVKTELMNAIYSNHNVNLSHVADGFTAPTTTSGGSPQRKNKSRVVTPGGGKALPQREGGVPAYIDLRMYSARVERVEKQLEEAKRGKITQDTSHMQGGSLDALGSIRGGLSEALGRASPAMGGGGNLSALGGDGDMSVEMQRLAAMRGTLFGTQRLVKRLFFNSWRAVVVRNKQVADAASAWIRIVTHSSTRFMLSAYYTKWRKFLSRKKEMETSLAEQVKHLTAENAAKDKEIAKLRKQLEQQPSPRPDVQMPVFTPTSVSDSLSPPTASIPARRPSMQTVENDLVAESMRMDLTTSRSTTPQMQAARLSSSAASGTPNAATLARRESSNAVKPSGIDAPFSGVESVPIPSFLEWWVRRMIASLPVESEKVTLTSLEAGMCDGRVYTVLLSILFPQSGVDICLQIEPAIKRVERLVDHLEQFGLAKKFITIADIANASVSNFALLAWIFSRWFEAQMDELPRHEVGIMPPGVDRERKKKKEVLVGIAGSHSKGSMEEDGEERREPLNPVLVDTLEKVNLTRMVVEGFRLLNERIQIFATSKILQKVRDMSKESASVLVDLVDFTAVKPFYFGEFEQRLDIDAEIRFMVPALRGHYTELKKIFDFYRALSTASQTGALLVRDFFRFVDDTKLSTRSGLTAAYIKEVIPVPEGEDGRKDKKTITKKQFVEILVHLSAATASAQGKLMEKGAVTQVLDQMITQQILPRAMISAKIEFKRRIMDVRVQEILNAPTNTKVLSRVFRHYAATDAMGRNVMTRDRFAQMLADLQLIDRNSGMRKKEILSIFTEVQDEDAIGIDEEGDQMSMTEFNEAIVAMAMFKVPHPLQALHLRLQTFLNLTFFPAVRVYLKK